MNLREIFVENFAGDLEYHPRRAVVYLILAVAAFCFWFLSPELDLPENKPLKDYLLKKVKEMSHYHD